MKKLIAFTVLVSFFFSFKTAEASGVLSVAGTSALPKERIIENEPDPRVLKLKAYLVEQNSPLAEKAACFIANADKYGLGKYGLEFLVPAITGLESSFAKRYPQGSYNAYGWAGGNYRWNSWEESIEHVTRALREKYIERGADTIPEIGPIYAESPTWAQRVAAIKRQIDAFYPPLEPTL